MYACGPVTPPTVRSAAHSPAIMDPARLTTRTTRSPRPETTTEPQAQAQQYRALTEPQPELPASPTTTQPISTPIRPTPRYGLDHLHLSDREDPPQPVSGSPETQSTGPVSFQASSVLATRRLLPTEPGTGAYPAAMGPTRHLDDHDPALGYRVASPMAGSPPRGRDSMLGHQRGLSRRATVGGQSQHFVPGMDGSVPVAEKAFVSVLSSMRIVRFMVE
ncbi:hypothetical protein BS17DRAFT_312532 [Gyrodon lividus]|nr:hypothetical protein BS17DRAFT_312532 [Gyrodon lividus]